MIFKSRISFSGILIFYFVGSVLTTTKAPSSTFKKRKSRLRNTGGFGAESRLSQKLKGFRPETVDKATEELRMKTAESKLLQLEAAQKVRLVEDGPGFSFSEYLRDDKTRCKKTGCQQRKRRDIDDSWNETQSSTPNDNGGTPSLPALSDNLTLTSPPHAKLSVEELRKVWSQLDFTKCNSILDEGNVLIFFSFFL